MGECRMKNRIIAAVLTVVILICALTVCTPAEDTNYHLWVGGIFVTRENALDVVGGGTVKFNYETNTLTLNNFSYEGYGTEWPYDDDKTSAAAIIYEGERDFTLELVGDNTVIQSGGADFGYGIFFSSNAAVTGTGKLTVKGSSAAASCYGVYSVKELVIKGGEINASVVGTSRYSSGLCGCGVTVTGGVINTAGGDNEWSAGIYSSKGLVVNGGTVTSAGGNATDYSSGIYCLEDVIINGGTVNAAAGKGNRFSDGIYSGGSFTMNGGTVTATGGTAAEYSSGLFLNGDTAGINGGTLTLSGGDAGVDSCGINETETGKKDISIGKDVSSVTLCGKSRAVNANVKSAVGGVVYENEDKTGQRAFAPPDAETDGTGYKQIVFPHAHTMTKVEAKQPSARDIGNIGYYDCKDCDSYFKDAQGTEYIPDKNSVLIPALGEVDMPLVDDKPAGNGLLWLWILLSLVLVAAAAVIVIMIKKKKK